MTVEVVGYVTRCPRHGEDRASTVRGFVWMLPHGHQYPLFPMAAPSMVRAEMVDPHERLPVRAAACVAKTSGEVVFMVAASDLPWGLDRGRVETHGHLVVKTLPM